MGEESDHVHIVALTDALLVPIRVVYLDNSSYPGAGDGSLEVTTHDFIPEAQQVQGKDLIVHVLYRPGHYDIMYPTSNL
jgi:ubiquitin thioesterase protein OTUB1